MGCDSSKLLPQHQLDGHDTKNNNNPIVFIKAFPKNPQHDSKSKGIQYLALVPMSPSFFPKPESLTELHQARCTDNAVLKMFCSFKNRPKAGSPELCGQPVISIEEYYRRLVTSLANSPERNPIPVVIYLWNPATATTTTPVSSSSPSSSHWEQVGYIGCRTCNFASQMKPSGEVGIFLCQKARGLSLATTIARSMCWFLKETSPPSLSSSDANSTSQKKPNLPLPPSHVEFSTRLDNRPVLDMLSTMSILIERVRIQALYQQSMMTMSMSTSSMAMMTTSKSQNHFAPSFSGIDHTATMDFDEDVLQKVESSQHQPQQGCTPSASNTFTYNVNDDDTDNMSLMKQQQKSSVMMMQGDHTSSGLLLANQQQQQQQQHSSSLSSSSGTSLLPFSIECSPLDSSSFTERSQDFLRAESIIGPDQDEDAFIEEHREEFLNGNFDDIVSKYGLDERMKFKIGAQDCEKIVTFLADTLQTLPSVGTTVEEQLMVKTLVNSFTTATCKPCNYFLSATNMPPPPLPTREEVEQAKISTSSSVSVGSSNTTVTHHQHSHSLLDSHVHHTSSGSLLHSTSSSNFVNTPASTSSSSNNLLQQQQQRFVNPQNHLLSAPNAGNTIISRSPTSSLSSKNSMHRHSITPSSTSASSSSGTPMNKILPIIDSMPVWSQSVLGDLIEGCRKSTELRKLQNNSKKKKQQTSSSSSSSPTLNNNEQQQQQHHEGKYQKVANAPAPVNGFFTHQQQQSKKQLVRQHYKQQKQMKKQQQQREKNQQQQHHQHDAEHNDYDDTEQHYYQQQQEQHYQQHHYQHQHHQHHHHPHHYQEQQQQMIQQPPAPAPAPVYPEKYFYDEPVVAQQQQQHQQHHHHHQSSYYHPHHQQPQQQQHQPAYHHHHQDHHHQYYHEQPMKKPPTAVFVPPPPPPQQQQQEQQAPTANITTPNNKGRARSKLAEAFLGEVRK